MSCCCFNEVGNTFISSLFEIISVIDLKEMLRDRFLLMAGFKYQLIQVLVIAHDAGVEGLFPIDRKFACAFSKCTLEPRCTEYRMTIVLKHANKLVILATLS